MDDKDHVFARFKGDKTAPADRRETLTIPRRAGVPGSRSVEVVHLRSGGVAWDRQQRQDPYVRAASWERGFPTKQAARASMPIETAAPEVAQPITHVMPAWGRATAVADADPAEERTDAPRRGRGRPRQQPVGPSTRSVADPFDATDDRANCMRCGYAVEPALEKRGMMMCSKCD